MAASGESGSGDAYAAGLRLLARREHSRRELRAKLALREHAGEAIDEALERLAAEDYLSEARFAEAYVRERVGRGYGESRIRAGLAERGVRPEDAQQALLVVQADWDEVLAETCRRRFGEAPPAGERDWLRRARFLAARGFDNGRIRRLLGERDRD